MKHPIFYDTHINRLIDKYRKDKIGTVASMVNQPISLGLLKFVEVASDIIDNGLNMIEVNREDFSSQISRDTIRKMKLLDIKFPLTSSSITLKDSEGQSSLFFSKTHSKIIISKNTNGITSTEFILSEDFTVQEYFDKYDITNEDFVLDCLSVLLYMSMYHSDKERVFKKVVKQKANSKNYIDKGLLRVVKLSVPTKQNSSTTQGNRKIEKLFIVRGHWRNQPTKDGSKLIWIDQFWKGQGSEKIQKVYKG